MNAKAHADARREIVTGLAVGITHRAIALVAVAAILAISFVSSLSVYMRQQQQIAIAQQQIAERSEAVGDLQDQLARWDDPNYVRAQARDRLGWVLPGEVGYRVIDKDGNVVGQIAGSASGTDSGETVAWYDAVWGSVKAADQPTPTEEEQLTPAADVTIGPDSQETPG